MAIAYDNATGDLNVGGTPSSRTFSHTVSGSDRVLIVCVCGNNISMTTPTVTYNSDSLTLQDSHSQTGNGKFFIYTLINPDTGSNDVVVTQGGIKAEYLTTHAVSYTGVNQTTPVGNFNYEDVESAVDVSLEITSTEDDSWTFGFGASQRNFTTSSDSTVRLGAGGSINQVYMDSNGTVIKNSADSLTISQSEATMGGLSGMAIYPAAASTTFTPKVMMF